MTEGTPVDEEAPVDGTGAAAPAGPSSGDPVLDALADQFPDARFEEAIGHDVVRVEAADVQAFTAAARDAGFDYFSDLCAVDHLDRRPRRYEVVVNLIDPVRPARLLIKVALDAPDPEMPTLTGVFPGANFYEREAWDLYGVRFDGHPDLTRILLPEDWEGHPMRKDAPVGSVPVQFKEPDAR
jgi:NADH-quinone oxidoreductase subunit C